MEKMTISLEPEVYNGLKQVIGKGNISKFLNDLARPHVVKADQSHGYARMAQEELRESNALEWSEGLIGETLPNETW